MDKQDIKTSVYFFNWMYKNFWEAKKIVEIPVVDALRKKYTVTINGKEPSQEVAKKIKDLNFDKFLKECLIFERLHGGCLLFLGYYKNDDETEGYNSEPSLNQQIDFLKVITKNHVVATKDALFNKLINNKFNVAIDGIKVNSDRFIHFSGSGSTRDEFFGISVLNSIAEEIKICSDLIRTSKSLSEKSSIFVASMSNLTMGDEQKKTVTAEILNKMSNNQPILINGDDVKIHESGSTIDGEISKMIEILQQRCASSNDIPASRYLGTTKGGLNHSLDGDLENYYNMLEGYQASCINDKIQEMYSLVSNVKKENIEVSFPPLWNQSDVEISQINKNRIDMVVSLVNNKLINEQEARELLSEYKIIKS